MRMVGIVLSTVLAAALASSCTKSKSVNKPSPKKPASTDRSGDDTIPSSEVEDHRAESKQKIPRVEKDKRQPLDEDIPDSRSTSGIVLDTEEPAGGKIGGNRSKPGDAPSSGGTEDDNKEKDGESQVSYKAYEGNVTQQQINEWVQADQEKRGAQATNYRYAFIPNTFLADAKEANYARIGLSKGLNHVASAADDVVLPEDVSDGHGIVFAIDIGAMWGDAAQNKWNVIASARQKRVFSPAPTLDLRAFPGGAQAPVSADRLVYNVLHGAIYNQLVDMPPRGTQLINRLQAREVTAKTAVRHAITYGPRYIQRREIPGHPGGLWESFDDFYGRRGDLRWKTSGNPVPRFRGDGMVADYGTVASETWYHMKNGLPAYIIWGNANQERTKAELSFVSDPLNHRDTQLVNGFCVFCHLVGVQSAPNDMWTAIENNEVRGNVQVAREFWTSNDELGKQYAEDRQIVVDALKKIVLGISDGDADFNSGIYNGADEREPCFFLVSTVNGSRLKGDTSGLRRRDDNGNIPGLNRGGNRGQQRRGGGFGSFGLKPTH